MLKHGNCYRLFPLIFPLLIIHNHHDQKQNKNAQNIIMVESECGSDGILFLKQRVTLCLG